jgi:hypothetical protein
MTEPKTRMGMRPIKIGKQEIHPLRIARFILGVCVVAHTAFIYHGPWQSEGMRFVVGGALIDVTMLTQGFAAWKSRHG